MYLHGSHKHTLNKLIKQNELQFTRKNLLSFKDNCQLYEKFLNFEWQSFVNAFKSNSFATDTLSFVFMLFFTTSRDFVGSCP